MLQFAPFVSQEAAGGGTLPISARFQVVSVLSVADKLVIMKWRPAGGGASRDSSFVMGEKKQVQPAGCREGVVATVPKGHGAVPKDAHADRDLARCPVLSDLTAADKPRLRFKTKSSVQMDAALLSGSTCPFAAAVDDPDVGAGNAMRVTDSGHMDADAAVEAEPTAQQVASKYMITTASRLQMPCTPGVRSRWGLALPASSSKVFPMDTAEWEASVPASCKVKLETTKDNMSDALSVSTAPDSDGGPPRKRRLSAGVCSSPQGAYTSRDEFDARSELHTVTSSNSQESALQTFRKSIERCAHTLCRPFALACTRFP